MRHERDGYAETKVVEEEKGYKGGIIKIQEKEKRMPTAYIIKQQLSSRLTSDVVSVQKCHKNDVASVSPSISAEASLSVRRS